MCCFFDVLEGSGRQPQSCVTRLEGSGRLNLLCFAYVDKFITFAWFWDGRFLAAQSVAFFTLRAGPPTRDYFIRDFPWEG